MKRQEKAESSLSESIEKLKKTEDKKWDKSNLILLGSSIILILLVIVMIFPSLLTGLLPGNDNKNVPKLEFITTTAPEKEDLKPSAAIKPEVSSDNSSIPDTSSTNTHEGEQYSHQRKSRLFFVKVNDMGQVSLKGSIKTVNYNTSPLTRTINALLQGPDTQALNQGLLTLIPVNSQLLAASIEGETAYLNFNEEFRRNPMGVEAYEAQLKQIIYTATEFPNVNKVQIMIEGKIYDYLGPEGVYIGSPLSRDDF